MAQVQLATAAAVDAKLGTYKPTSTLPFAAATDVVPTDAVLVIGMEAANTRLFGRNGITGFISQSDNFGTTWTHNKALPPTIRYNNMTKMVRFKGHFYLTADDASGNWFVYRCPAVAAATAFAWEASPVFTYRAGANNNVRTAFNAGSDYIFLFEYASPPGGPRLYRSQDGVTWTQVWTDAAALHGHAVIEDPYNAGHIYATPGDNTTASSVIRSTDHGATWSTIISAATNLWQSVQISFDPDWVWLAMDRVGATAAVFNRTELVPYVASSNWHYNTPVPGGAVGDRFYQIAYYGAVDPATGIYYTVANDTSVPGNKSGLFYLTEPGGRLELLDVPTQNGAEVFIGGGKVWCARRSFPTQAA